MIYLRSVNKKKIYLNPVNGREYWIRKKGKRVYCGHGKFPYTCGDCGGKGFCKEHNVRLTRCVECKGKTRCEEHGKLKRYCRDCNGGKKQYCDEHGKELRYCRDCGGWNLCKHDKRKYLCMFCTPDSKYLCSNRCGQTLSDARRKRGLVVCSRCQLYTENRDRVEHEWLVRLKGWGYHPSVHDKVIKGDGCVIINRRRADFVFITAPSFPYHIVVECDENGHSGHDVSCEMGRLEDVHDQLIGNTGAVKPIVVVRFNPYSRVDCSDEVKETLEYLFKGTYTVRDIRGVNLYKVIGYTRARERVYKDSTITGQLV